MKTRLKMLALVLLGLGLFMTAGDAFAHGMSEEEKRAIIEGGNWAFLKLGATHMLTGYDHLAFVFGIIFFLTSFRDIVKYVTAFTLGHSIPLIFATFAGFQLSYYLVEPIIALSVCYIAFHNIDGFRKYFGIEPPNMLAMIFGLGIIHGFGLSTRLQELPLSEDNLLMNIISFNVGVEIGQIVALALMLGALQLMRNWSHYADFRRLANYFLIAWGGLLFLGQMHALEHATNDELSVAQSGSSDAAPLAATEITDWKDEIKVTIGAKWEREYKFLLKKGAKIQYSWETDGAKLFFDFHGEPKGDTTGYFKSYKESTDSKSSGTLTAPFEGTHGWYWKNTTNKPVVVTLKVKGDYTRTDKPQ